MNLDEYRTKIDEIDAAIITLLDARAGLSRSIGILKARAGLLVLDRMREKEVLGSITTRSEGFIDNAVLARIYGEILLESRRIQSDAAAEIRAEAVQ